MFVINARAYTTFVHSRMVTLTFFFLTEAAIGVYVSSLGSRFTVFILAQAVGLHAAHTSCEQLSARMSSDLSF